MRFKSTAKRIRELTDTDMTALFDVVKTTGVPNSHEKYLRKKYNAEGVKRDFPFDGDQEYLRLHDQNRLGLRNADGWLEVDLIIDPPNEEMQKTYEAEFDEAFPWTI